MAIFGSLWYNLGKLVNLFYPSESPVKILKFLHASNFQLHMPVTCWSTPFWEKREVSNSADDSVDELAGPPDPSPTLSLERTGSWLFGAVFPELPPALSEECLSAPWKSAERVLTWL